MVTSVESTSKNTKRYFARLTVSGGLGPDDLQQIGEVLQEMVGIRRRELFAGGGAGRDHGHVDAAVAGGADVDGHVADEQRLRRLAPHRLQRERQVLRVGLARAGQVGADDGPEVTGEAEEIEDLL